MASKKRHTVPFRRKRQEKTNYKKRLALLKSNKPRLVVRLSLKNASAQLVEFQPEGDRILAAAHTKELIKSGWKAPTGNVPSSYLLGFLIGKKAMTKNIKEAVLDIGLKHSIKGSRCYAVLKGAIDSGLNVPFSEEILPSQDRICGKHISEYAKVISANPEIYKKMFSQYLKKTLKPEVLSEHFEEFKKKLTNEKEKKKENESGN